MPQKLGGVLSSDPNAGIPTDLRPDVTPKPQTGGSIAGDVAVGAGKGMLRNVINLAKMNPLNVLQDAMIPDQAAPVRSGYVPPQVEEGLKSANAAQTGGGIAADIASVLIPAGMAMRGAKVASAATQAAPAVTKLPAQATAQAVADWIAANRAGMAAPAAANVATVATPTAMSAVRNFGGQAIKYGVGGAVANELRRLLTGGQ